MQREFFLFSLSRALMAECSSRHGIICCCARSLCLGPALPITKGGRPIGRAKAAGTHNLRCE